MTSQYDIFPDTGVKKYILCINTTKRYVRIQKKKRWVREKKKGDSFKKLILKVNPSTNLELRYYQLKVK